MSLTLRIVTPARRLVEAQVSEVTAPGLVGEFGVLPQHAAFLGALDVGAVRFVEHGERRTVLVYGGLAEVRDDAVTILAADAEFPEEIDAAEASRELAEIDERLRAADLATEEGERLLAARRRAEVRAVEAGAAKG